MAPAGDILFKARLRELFGRNFRKTAHVGEKRRALCAEAEKAFETRSARLALYELRHARAHVVALVKRLDVQARQLSRTSPRSSRLTIAIMLESSS